MNFQHEARARIDNFFPDDGETRGKKVPGCRRWESCRGENRRPACAWPEDNRRESARGQRDSATSAQSDPDVEKAPLLTDGRGRRLPGSRGDGFLQNQFDHFSRLPGKRGFMQCGR